MLGFLSIEVVRYGSLDYARQLRERSLALNRSIPDAVDHHSWCLWELGEICRLSGAPTDARRCYEEARPIFEALRNEVGLAYYRRGLGDLALAAEDFAAAAGHFTAAGEILSGRPDQAWSQVYMANGLARALVGMGKPSEALGQVKSSLIALRRQKLPHLEPLLLATIAELALAGDRADITATVCGLLSHHPLTWNETRAYAASLAAEGRAALGDAEADAADARGRALDLKALVAGLADIAADEPDQWLDEATRLIQRP
jgi:hypothetical protein